MEETIRACLEEFVDTDFVELFNAHLLGKKIKIISFAYAENIHKTNGVAIILRHLVQC